MDFAAKLSKSFEKIIIEELLLYMVVPRRINFTQLGRYGKARQTVLPSELRTLAFEESELASLQCVPRPALLRQ